MMANAIVSPLFCMLADSPTLLADQVGACQARWKLSRTGSCPHSFALLIALLLKPSSLNFLCMILDLLLLMCVELQVSEEFCFAILLDELLPKPDRRKNSWSVLHLFPPAGNVPGFRMRRNSPAFLANHITSLSIAIHESVGRVTKPNCLVVSSPPNTLDHLLPVRFSIAEADPTFLFHPRSVEHLQVAVFWRFCARLQVVLPGFLSKRCTARVDICPKFAKRTNDLGLLLWHLSKL